MPATLAFREKRFLAHARLDDGTQVVAHTNNTGSMLGCKEPGSRIWLSPADNPRRKLAWTWELVAAGDPPALVGVNTLRANRLAREGIEAGVVAELAGHDWLRAEAKAESGSRLDFLLGDGDAAAPDARTWVEVKSVTLAEGSRALFPDARTDRGRKHLEVLARLAAAGDRAVLLFVVQREDVREAGAADAIDPAYGAALREALAGGVEVLAYRAALSPERIELAARIPFTAP